MVNAVADVAVPGVEEFSCTFHLAAADDVAVVEIVDFRNEVRKVHADSVVEIAHTVVPAHFEVVAVGRHLAGVGVGIAVAHRPGNLDGQKHVGSLFPVVVAGETQAVVEERGVDTDVGRGGCFPGDVLHGKSAQRGCLVGNDFAVLIEEGVAEGHERHVGEVGTADAFVTELTPRCAEFEERHCAGIDVLHEFFLRNHPACRERGEGTPAVFACEAARTVAAYIGLQKIAVVVGVKQTAEV